MTMTTGHDFTPEVDNRIGCSTDCSSAQQSAREESMHFAAACAFGAFAQPAQEPSLGQAALPQAQPRSFSFSA